MEPVNQTEPITQSLINNDSSAKEVIKSEDVIAISAENPSEENEVRADKNYKGKIIKVTGSIGVSFNQTYVVLSSGKDFSITYIQCFLRMR